jgi:hypothetical protein
MSVFSRAQDCITLRLAVMHVRFFEIKKWHRIILVTPTNSHAPKLKGTL